MELVDNNKNIQCLFFRMILGNEVQEEAECAVGQPKHAYRTLINCNCNSFYLTKISLFENTFKNTSIVNYYVKYLKICSESSYEGLV